jgi:hypothetical protein
MTNTKVFKALNAILHVAIMCFWKNKLERLPLATILM